jgi:hypothetical protein
VWPEESLRASSWVVRYVPSITGNLIMFNERSSSNLGILTGQFAAD